MIISISGIDGSGKTSVIEHLRRHLESEGKDTSYVWLRYNHYLTKVLLAYCRVAGLTRYEYPDGVRVGYHDFYRSKTVSWLFVIFTYIDTLLASLFIVYLPSLLTSRIYICDRWSLDIMIDLQIDTGITFPEGGVLERAFRGLMPSGTACYVIMRNTESLLACRPENARDANFEARLELYRDYARRSWVSRIDNESTIEDAVAGIVQTAIHEGAA